MAAVDLKTNQLDASLPGLRVQLDQVMGKIDETMRRDQTHIERLANIEGLFQDHVSTAFKKMEHDLKIMEGIIMSAGLLRCEPCGPAEHHDRDRHTRPAEAAGPSRRSCPSGNLHGMTGQANAGVPLDAFLPPAGPALEQALEQAPEGNEPGRPRGQLWDQSRPPELQLWGRSRAPSRS